MTQPQVKELNGIVYIWNEPEDGYSKYTLFIDNRPVVDIYAHVDEIKNPIYVAKPGDNARFATKSRAYRVKDGSRISSDSIRHAALTQAFGWVVDLYVPKES
jgi:hypothetical protein